MKIRVLEWIGLIMTDQLAFLVVAISFLYVFTDPVKEAQSAQVASRTIQDQELTIQSLQNKVKTLEMKGKQASDKPDRSTPGSQVHVRLFPGTLVVAVGGGEFYRMTTDALIKMIKDRQAQKKTTEVILSAETGIAYTRLTELADTVKKLNTPVQFGW